MMVFISLWAVLRNVQSATVRLPPRKNVKKKIVSRIFTVAIYRSIMARHWQ